MNDFDTEGSKTDQLVKVNAGILLIILGLIFPWQHTIAEDPMSLPRLSGAIQLDGICDEPAWKNVESLPLIMYQPTHGGTPTERTEIRITYDDHYFYASACFYDSDPTDIRVNSLYRDRTNNDDTFTLIIDTFNDKENALLFETNPAGIGVDVAISRDGRSSNGNWNTYWDVVTVQNEEGWFAEMRIPFSSLGFQKSRNEAVIGLIAYRFIGRKNERLLFPAISNQWQFFVPSQAQEVSLKNIQSQKPVYITPYLLGGYGENSVLSETGDHYDMEGQETGDIGLDVKYNKSYSSRAGGFFAGACFLFGRINVKTGFLSVKPDSLVILKYT